MKSRVIVLIAIVTICLSFKSSFGGQKNSDRVAFDLDKDLLLGHFDCKTDVDDLHSVAAFKTLLSNSKYSQLNYHAVAGTYGMQEGRYVPANALFQLAFGDNWTDAHKNFNVAVKKVATIVQKTLARGGAIWIAEAGQSDFSAELVKAIQIKRPELDIRQRIHVVQHSDWNEKVTTPEQLQFVKQNTDYHKIPDGNEVGNGTPGFRTPGYTHWKTEVTNPHLQEIWQLAVALGIKFNGKEERYNNEAIAAGGLDFSDISETCWILGLDEIKDTAHFFELFGKE